MASGPYFDQRRGTYRIQWFNGVKWVRPTVYRVPGWKSGSPQPRSTPPEVTKALADYTAKEQAIRRNALPIDAEKTVTAFLDEYHEVYTREHAAGSLIQLGQSQRNFLTWCSTHKVVKLEKITASVCQKYLDHRASQTSRKTNQPISPRRLNMERALLMGAWTRAVRLGALPANPWTATQAPGWERDRKRRVLRPSWTPEEFTRLHQAARPWLRDLLVLGTQTGLRISALVNLEWRDVEWTRDGPGFGTVRVRPELDKTARGYSVPMSRACHDLLAARFARKDADERYVLTSARGGKVRVSVVDRSIRAAARKAGLGEITSPAHMLRRSFGRWAILGHLTGRPIPLYVVSTWFGHSDTKMTQYYLDITETESQNWMEDRLEPAADQPGSRNDSGGHRPVST